MLEHGGDAFTGVCRKAEAGSGHGGYGDAERPVINDAKSSPLVPLFRPRRFVRGVHRRARLTRRRAIPSRFPTRRSQRVPQLFGSALADVYLVPPLLDHDHQIDGGWVDLCAPDSGCIRLALAAIGRAASPSDMERG